MSEEGASEDPELHSRVANIIASYLDEGLKDTSIPSVENSMKNDDIDWCRDCNYCFTCSIFSKEVHAIFNSSLSESMLDIMEYMLLTNLDKAYEVAINMTLPEQRAEDDTTTATNSTCSLDSEMRLQVQIEKAASRNKKHYSSQVLMENWDYENMYPDHSADTTCHHCFPCSFFCKEVHAYYHARRVSQPKFRETLDYSFKKNLSINTKMFLNFVKLVKFDHRDYFSVSSSIPVQVTKAFSRLICDVVETSLGRRLGNSDALINAMNPSKKFSAVGFQKEPVIGQVAKAPEQIKSEAAQEKMYGSSDVALSSPNSKKLARLSSCLDRATNNLVQKTTSKLVKKSASTSRIPSITKEMETISSSSSSRDGEDRKLGKNAESSSPFMKRALSDTKLSIRSSPSPDLRRQSSNRKLLVENKPNSKPFGMGRTEFQAFTYQGGDVNIKVLKSSHLSKHIPPPRRNSLPSELKTQVSAEKLKAKLKDKYSYVTSKIDSGMRRFTSPSDSDFQEVPSQVAGRFATEVEDLNLEAENEYLDCDNMNMVGDSDIVDRESARTNFIENTEDRKVAHTETKQAFNYEETTRDIRKDMIRLCSSDIPVFYASFDKERTSPTFSGYKGHKTPLGSPEPLDEDDVSSCKTPIFGKPMTKQMERCWALECDHASRKSTGSPKVHSVSAKELVRGSRSPSKRSPTTRSPVSSIKKRSSSRNPSRRPTKISNGNLIDTPDSRRERSSQPDSRRERSSPPNLRRERSSPPDSRRERSSPPYSRRERSSPSYSRRERSSPPDSRRKRSSPSYSRRERSSPPDSRRERSSSSYSQRERSSPPYYRKERSSPPYSRRERSSPSYSRRERSSPPYSRRERSSPPDSRRERSSPPDFRRERSSPSYSRREKRSRKSKSPSKDRISESPIMYSRKLGSPIKNNRKLTESPGKKSSRTPESSPRQSKHKSPESEAAASSVCVDSALTTIYSGEEYYNKQGLLNKCLPIETDGGKLPYKSSSNAQSQNKGSPKRFSSPELLSPKLCSPFTRQEDRRDKSFEKLLANYQHGYEIQQNDHIDEALTKLNSMCEDNSEHSMPLDEYMRAFSPLYNNADHRNWIASRRSAKSPECSEKRSRQSSRTSRDARSLRSEGSRSGTSTIENYHNKHGKGRPVSCGSSKFPSKSPSQYDQNRKKTRHRTKSASPFLDHKSRKHKAISRRSSACNSSCTFNDAALDDEIRRIETKCSSASESDAEPLSETLGRVEFVLDEITKMGKSKSQPSQNSRKFKLSRENSPKNKLPKKNSPADKDDNMNRILSKIDQAKKDVKKEKDVLKTTIQQTHDLLGFQDSVSNLKIASNSGMDQNELEKWRKESVVLLREHEAALHKILKYERKLDRLRAFLKTIAMKRSEVETRIASRMSVHAGTSKRTPRGTPHAGTPSKTNTYNKTSTKVGNEKGLTSSNMGIKKSFSNHSLRAVERQTPQSFLTKSEEISSSKNANSTTISQKSKSKKSHKYAKQKETTVPETRHVQERKGAQEHKRQEDIMQQFQKTLEDSFEKAVVHQKDKRSKSTEKPFKSSQVVCPGHSLPKSTKRPKLETAVVETPRHIREKQVLEKLQNTHKVDLPNNKWREKSPNREKFINDKPNSSRKKSSKIENHRAMSVSPNPYRGKSSEREKHRSDIFEPNQRKEKSAERTKDRGYVVEPNSLRDRSPRRGKHSSVSVSPHQYRGNSPEREKHRDVSVSPITREGKLPQRKKHRSNIVEPNQLKERSPKREKHRNIRVSPNPYRGKSPKREKHRDISVPPDPYRGRSPKREKHRNISVSPNQYRGNSPKREKQRNIRVSPNQYRGRSPKREEHRNISVSPNACRENSTRREKHGGNFVELNPSGGRSRRQDTNIIRTTDSKTGKLLLEQLQNSQSSLTVKKRKGRSKSPKQSPAPYSAETEVFIDDQNSYQSISRSTKRRSSAEKLPFNKHHTTQKLTVPYKQHSKKQAEIRPDRPRDLLMQLPKYEGPNKKIQRSPERPESNRSKSSSRTSSRNRKRHVSFDDSLERHVCATDSRRREFSRGSSSSAITISSSSSGVTLDERYRVDRSCVVDHYLPSDSSLFHESRRFQGNIIY